jgi:hypothetical protein
MKSLGLGYQKIDMCPNFCKLYYLENSKLIKCRICGHSRYNPELAGEGLLKTLLSTWHDTNHMMRWMEWWCIFPMVKHGNTLTVCILTFQQNQETCILGYVQTNSIYSGHLLLLILVVRLYSRFTTCHRVCVWGWSLCFYLRSYLVLIIQARI